MAAKLLDGTRLLTLGGQDTLIGVATFTNWLEAYSNENRPLSDFYRSRFREELKPPFRSGLTLARPTSLNRHCHLLSGLITLARS